MKVGLFHVIPSQLRKVPPVVSTDLTGKTIMVIGANTGLGFEASKHFAGMNPGRLIMGCRSEQKGKDALKNLKAETGYTKAELWLIDLCSFKSVRAFADKFEKDGGRLDVLVANAGVIHEKYRVTQDGWEEALQVNNIATSLLCLLLAPRLVDTGNRYQTRTRIVSVASMMHYWVDIEKKLYEADNSFQLMSSKEYCTPSVMMSRYMVTKLLNVFFTHSLSELLKDTPVIVNCLCPGVCKSDLNRNQSTVAAIVNKLIQTFLAWTTEQGSRNIVYAAVGSSDDPDKLRGACIDLTEVMEPSDHVIGEEGKKRRDKVWDDLIRELSKIDDRIPGIVRQYP